MTDAKNIDNERSRRRVPRRVLRQNIGLLVRGKYSIVECYELGEGGVLIVSPEKLEVKQRVVITIRVSGMLSAVTLGHVVYVLQPKNSNDIIKYGIEFDQIDFDVKRKIRNFVASSHGEYAVVTEETRSVTTGKETLNSSSIKKLKTS